FNRRTSKTVNGKTTEFIWQGHKLIAETDNDKHWQSYLYEQDSFRPLALVQGNAQQGKTQLYWYQNDQLGTPIGLTDGFGETLYECQYNGYGQIIDETYHEVGNRAIPDNPLRFQGQYYDEETGLHYNLNRYYDPFVGRYITQDPIKLIGGLNFYQYCQNPVNWIDPLGFEGMPGGKKYEYDMINNPGPLAEIKGVKVEDIEKVDLQTMVDLPAANFAGGKYNINVLKSKRIFYRVGKAGGGDNAWGQWFTSSPTQSIALARLDLAIKKRWYKLNGELDGISEVQSLYVVEIPEGIVTFEGPIGYQGGFYLGNPNIEQIFIRTPWKIPERKVLAEIPLP
ncbi:RHS repeat domain-containing protein, partial [Gilliamella apicola]|uniref:RHS repeat domain-containing protein n=1 Tax=Gilliamella apicola TaxID=1196095 RepID=UPI0015E8EB4C